MITGSAVVPLSLCFVDVRYQGMRTHKHLNRLRNKWDERKLTPIILVWHLEEHRFAIVDGQGRFIIAGEKGIDRLNAIILMDAPEDLNERLKFEAEYFIGQDSEGENVKPLEKHLSRVIIGDVAAVSLEKLLNKYGTQTSHIKNGICSLKNQYFSSQNSAQAAAELHSNAFCMYFGSL